MGRVYLTYRRKLAIRFLAEKETPSQIREGVSQVTNRFYGEYKYNKI